MSLNNPNHNFNTIKEYSHKILNYRVSTVPASDISFNMVDEACYLKGIHCDAIFSGINAKHIVLYDVSGIPDLSNNIGDAVFGFFISTDFPIHEINFPSDGLDLKNGLGATCVNLGGGGSLSNIDSSFYYSLKKK